MLDSPAFVVAQYLISETIFGDPTDSLLVWPLYQSHLPDAGTPDDSAAIFDSDGMKDGRLMDGPNIIHFGVQVMVRSLNNQEGWSKIQEVCVSLETIQNEQVSVDSNTFTLVGVSQRGSPMFIGLEDGTKRRSLFTVNFTVTILGE